MSQQNAQAPHSRLTVAGTVMFYLVAALTMVIANKWVLSSTSAPLFFLFAQLVIAVLLFLLTHLVGLFTLPFTINATVIRGMAPLVIVNVLGLSFNNYTLKYVDASFYQIARGLVLPTTVLLSYLFLKSRPSLRVLLSCALVTLGFFIGVFLDNYNTAPVAKDPMSASSDTAWWANSIGIIFGLLSSVTTASSAVIIKQSLDVVGGSTFALAWYNNLFSSIVIFPLIFLVGEGPAVYQLLFEDEEGWSTFLYGTLITGLFGFLICLAGFLSIKVTSPITHMVSSAVRGVVVTLLGIWFFSEVITSGRAASISTILLGSVYYTYVKNSEQQQNHRETEKYERVPLDEVEAGRATSPSPKRAD
ncbi:hypothetical protein M422DRAFT_233576 [Sphaerobolus stellatus SS14]|uniref:Sugar phosphate transporter domain-containing protein n=1 Tax=Sphaerobolus stellatus (strain SS14) TaxID=990650 RepID=A0A0C9UGU2_SPHS4|nr:hypothetical protein M422DRAFT_233576 [Sphaerobolus stellatus SS14]